MNVYQRILKVMNAVTSINKDKSISFGGESYKAVTHDAVSAALHMPMVEAGVFAQPNVESCAITDFEVKNKYGDLKKWYRADVHIKVRFLNAEDPKDFFESQAFAYAIDSSDKAPSKAYSLALKSIYLKTFMLESSDDEESRDFENQQSEGGKNARIKNDAGVQKRQAVPGGAGPVRGNPDGHTLQGHGAPGAKHNSQPVHVPGGPELRQGLQQPAIDDGREPSKPVAPVAPVAPVGPGEHPSMLTADEEEQRRLIRLIFAVSHKNGWTEEDLRKAIKGAFGHDSTKQLSWVQTTRLKQLIEMKKTVDQVVNELKGTR